MKYIKKPVTVEAIQLKHSTKSQEECIKFTNGKARKNLDGGLIIPTLEGDHIANTGDFIIKGEFYPCKPDIFEMTYQPA